MSTNLPLRLLDVVAWPGSVLHEVAHYLAAVSFGSRAQMHWLPPRVIFEVDGLTTAERLLVGLAPALLGLAVLTISIGTGTFSRLLERQPVIWGWLALCWINLVLRTSLADLVGGVSPE